MKKILLFSTVGPKWIRSVSDYIDPLNYKITGYITTKAIHQDVKNVLSDAKFYDRSVDYATNFDHVIDFDLLSSLSNYEREAFAIIERGVSNKFHENTYYLSLLYFKTIQYCLKILDETKPDIIIMGVPHTGVSYVLYIIAKAKNIKLYMFDRLKIQGFYGFFESIENKHPEVVSYYKSALTAPYNIELNEDIRGYVDNIASDYKINSHRNIIPVENIHSKNLIQSFYHELKLSDYKIAKTTLKFFRSIKIRIKQSKLRRVYESYCVREIDLDTPYIYLALHQQPEKTTSPNGGIFSQQWLILNNIVKSLPKGWKVYVREHPATFLKYSDAILRYRNKSFYSELLKFHNVELVSLNFNQDLLINNSKAVSTSTGTVAFEAVLRGIPALAFGYAHYLGCEGIFDVKKETDLKSAIEIIQSGYKVDLDKVLLFLQSLEASPRIIYQNKSKVTNIVDEEEAKLILFKKIIADFESIIQYKFDHKNLSES